MRSPHVTLCLLWSIIAATQGIADPVKAPVGGVSGLNEGYSIQRTPSKKVACTLFYMVVAPQLDAQEWVFVAPWAPDTPGQNVQYVRSSPAGKIACDHSIYERKLLTCRIIGGESTRTTAGVKVFYGAQLYARHLSKNDELAAVKTTVENLTKSDRSLFLRADQYYGHRNTDFSAWVKEKGYLRRKGEGEIDFAGRVFQDMAQSFTYDYAVKMDRSLMSVCHDRKSDCGGLSFVFVSVMRSQGIPARSMFGRWATSAVKDQKVKGVDYYQSHVKAEFYAQGVGWVPVDISSAVLHDRSESKLAYFGQDKGDFITMHFDPGLEVDSYHFGKQKLDWLQNVVFWVSGSGSLNGRIGTGGWEVK
ncbi:transglutaminase [Oceaniferula spumae]|uniref:Transglutaminase n=1 Tax=Oceaniferula spumae TaxID=2979115 RepID=A0AAT9FPJ8_9BACT